MTKEEAILFFPYSEEDDLLDLYDERFFEYKQFFLSKTPIRKVFLAKEKKMQQMYASYLFLSGQTDTQQEEIQFSKYTFTTSILETFNLYQQYRNELKNKILQSNSVIELSATIYNLLQLQTAYYENWSPVEFLEKETITISKEIDPMQLLFAIQEFNKLGGFTFEDLNSKRNISPIMLINEAKRLSLCRKLEKKWMTLT